MKLIFLFYFLCVIRQQNEYEKHHRDFLLSPENHLKGRNVLD